MGEFEGIDGTGGNGDNREIAIVLDLFCRGQSNRRVHAINKAQLLSYMKLLDIPLGLIINFNELKLTDGVSRLIIPGANLE
jgi:GxxExxY protein